MSLDAGKLALIRDRGGGGAGGASAPPDYLAVTSKKDCFYF